MSNAGRHSKYEPERVERILEAIREGNTHATAAQVGGIHISTFYQWIKDRKDFGESVVAAERDANRIIVQRRQRDLYVSCSPQKRGSGYVYLVHCDTTPYFKIGISKCDPSVRLSTLQTSCPLELHMIHVAYCDHRAYVESVLHDLYSSRRTRGEWFDMTGVEIPDIIDAMDAYATAQIGLF